MNLANIIETASRERGGFVTSDQVKSIVGLSRLFQLSVRCGNCRFLCSAQDVEHLIRCIEAGGDYVRDVSIPANSLQQV